MKKLLGIILACIGLFNFSGQIAARPNSDVEVIKGIFAIYLKDPGSAQVSISRSSIKLVCGTYNAKNSFGGYVGFKPFAYELVSGDLFMAGAVVRKSGLIEDAVAMVEYDGTDFSEFNRRASLAKALMDLTEAKLRGCESA